MDRIKASQKKLQGPNYKEPDNHYVGMFAIQFTYCYLFKFINLMSIMFFL